MTEGERVFVEALERRRMLAGVTVITHGFGGSAGDWVATMGDVIARQSGELANQPRYLMTVTDPGHDNGPLTVTSTRLGPAMSSWASGEIIVLLDWSDVAGSFPFGGYHRPTDVVGAAVAGKFLGAFSIPDLASPLAQLPIHLIGHSRGASLISEMARSLGEKGAWVDQVTYLDPHPVDGERDPFGLDFGDTPMRVYENVIYAEDYWRTQGDTSFDFTGEAVSGAYNLQFSESVLTSGGYSVEHSDTHLWYHGTIGPVGGPFDNSDDPSDGDPSVGAAWYSPPHPARDSSGFRYSRLGEGARPAAGLKSSGAFRNAVTLTASGAAVWDNVAISGLLDDVTIEQGTALDVTVTFDDRAVGGADDATITIGFDQDDNPFNGFIDAAMFATPTSGGTVTTPVPTDAIAGGYRVVARISNGVNTRYYYSPGRALITVPGFDATWIGPASGSWNVAANWSGGAEPQIDDRVAIFASDVSISANTMIAGLSLSGDASIDLHDNDLIVNYSGGSPYASLRGWLFDGHEEAAGIYSSTAQAGNGSTTLGYAEARDALNLSSGQTQNFSGFVVDDTSVLIKYTYTGDADLDGDLDGDDYFRIDSNIALGVGDWFAGDFDYDQDIDGDDYFWIDSNIAGQGGPI